MSTPPSESAAPPPDAQVKLPRRRTFTAEYKAQILEEAGLVTESGGIGAILRREGLYSSQLAEWRRRQGESGASGLKRRKAGRPPKLAQVKALEKKVRSLEQENAVLRERLRHSEIIVEAQKKLAQVLSLLQEPAERREKHA